MLTIGQVNTFHRLDCRMYRKLVHLGHPPTTARDIVSLWMWLQCIGVHVIDYLSDCRRDEVIRRFATEARLIVDHCVRNLPTPGAGVPCTQDLTKECLNFQFYAFNKDVVRRGVEFILNGVGEVIFDDQLGDMARPYNIRAYLPSEDCRTLFVSVTEGNRLNMPQIISYFQRNFGVYSVVETRMEETAQPRYGRVVVSSEDVCAQMFRRTREEVVAIDIGRTKVWARKINPMFESG